jgi:HEAT repeat protein
MGSRSSLHVALAMMVVALPPGCETKSGEAPVTSAPASAVPGGAGTTSVVPPPRPERGTFLRKRLDELTLRVAREDAERERTAIALDEERFAKERATLKSLDPEERARAMAAIAAMGWPAQEPLLSAVKEPGLDYERCALLDAISRVADVTALPDLLLILQKDTSPVVRSFAAMAMGRIGDVSILPDLVLRLKYEEDGFVVNGICRAAGELGLTIGTRKLLASLDGRIRVREEAAEILSGVFGDAWSYDTYGFASVRTRQAREMRAHFFLEGERILLERNRGLAPTPRLEKRILEAIFELAQYQMRNVDDARWTLEGLGPLAVPSLLLGLRDENQYIRAHCVEVFVRMGLPGRAGREALRPLLADPLHRPDVIKALGKLEDRESVDLILSALDDPAVDVRICAADALGRLGDDKALPALRRVHDSAPASEELRVATVFGMALLGDASRLPEAIEILDTSAPVGLWDVAERIDALYRARARKGEPLPEGYPFAGTPEEKVAFFRGRVG